MTLLDLLFPRKCLGCGREGGYFCSECLNLVSLCQNQICPLCTKNSFGGLVHLGCRRPLGFDGLTVVFEYKGLIKKAIKKLKYRFITDLAGDLTELFLSFCGQEKGFVNFCRQKQVVLVPIPLHPSRLRWRGFNQSELISKKIATNLGLQFLPHLLVRRKPTLPQAELDKMTRRQNLKNAFSLSPNITRSQYPHIILFDDIWTSGVTLREAAKVLKRNGAKKVWGLTLAR